MIQNVTLLLSMSVDETELDLIFLFNYIFIIRYNNINFINPYNTLYFILFFITFYYRHYVPKICTYILDLNIISCRLYERF